MVFEVEYLWNGWVEKDRVNANKPYTIAPTLDTSINFAFGPRLRKTKIRFYDQFRLAFGGNFNIPKAVGSSKPIVHCSSSW